MIICDAYSGVTFFECVNMKYMTQNYDIDTTMSKTFFQISSNCLRQESKV